MSVEGVSSQSLENPISIRISKLGVQNSTSMGSLIVYKSFVYQGLTSILDGANLSSNNVSIAPMVALAHSAQRFVLQNCSFMDNTGIIASLHPKSAL